VSFEGQRCYACGGAAFDLVPAVKDSHAGTDASYDLLRCRRCGSARLRQVLSDEALQRIYPDDYYSYVPKPSRPSIFLRLFGLANDRHTYKPSFKHLLEVGSGAGAFLETIRSRGESVTGLERSPAAAAAGRARGLDIRVGDVTNPATFAPGQFDLVYANHSIEHLSDPAAAIHSILGWLAPGGKVFIAVPRFDGLVARLFGRHWYHLNAPLHVSNFSRRGVLELLTANGLAVKRVEYHSESVSIPMSIYIALGGHIDRLRTPMKVLIGGAAILCGPLCALIDLVGWGDCIEVHCEATARVQPDAFR
jgi:SAM-dependent methyltransferase